MAYSAYVLDSAKGVVILLQQCTRCTKVTKGGCLTCIKDMSEMQCTRVVPLDTVISIYVKLVYTSGLSPVEVDQGQHHRFL